MGNKGLPSAVIYYDNICDTTKLTIESGNPVVPRKLWLEIKTVGKEKPAGSEIGEKQWK